MLFHKRRIVVRCVDATGDRRGSEHGAGGTKATGGSGWEVEAGGVMHFAPLQPGTTGISGTAVMSEKIGAAGGRVGFTP